MAFHIRFIPDNANSAAFNMAADILLAEKCAKENSLFLRIYTWKKPSITIGYLQKAAEILDMEAINRDKIDWIRRPTGGRAVFHYEDLTYSCIFSHNIKKLGSTIKESYSIISQCLRNGLEKAGIISETHDSENELKDLKREVKLPCFLAPNRDEIMINGKKLVGSAQRRMLSSVLQHGSIPLTNAFQSLPNYLSISDHQRALQKQLLQQKTTCVADIMQNAKYSTLLTCLVEGFRETINTNLIEYPWSSQELSEINSITSSHRFIKEYNT